MGEDSEFFFSLIVNGISIGMLYALIALGFVLVYKATEALNFAQGEFVMLSGYIAAALLTAKGMPVIGAIIGTIAIMIGFSFALERVVLRPLLGRPIVAVIMATIGLAAILRGLPPLTFGAETRAVPLPIGDDPLVIGPATVPPIQVIGFVVTLIFLGGFTWFFRKSRTGVALRAVAENQQVAAAMGINVERYFALAWAMAGIASAVSGIVWGNMLGVDVQLALVGLKVFPVVILGGLDFYRRRCGRRVDRRRRGKPDLWIYRSLCRWRHQGLRALSFDDRGADVQALRPLRQTQDRTGIV